VLFLSKNHGLFLMLRAIALALRAPVAKVLRRSAAKFYDRAHSYETQDLILIPFSVVGKTSA
jgi:hypothetical protein